MITDNPDTNSKSAESPSSRPMTPRQHTKLTDEILEVIDEQPTNRYEVALRLTRWAENYGHEIAREAQQSILRGFRRRDFVRDDFYEVAVIDRLAELTHKQEEDL